MAASHSASNGTTKREAAPHEALDGNVLLQLAGYAKTNPAVERSLFYFYFQTTYALYPRRLYAAQAGCIVNGSDSIMRAKFSPDQQWLKAHQVRYVAAFGNGNIGGAPARWERLSWNNESTGANQSSEGELMAFAACCLYLLLIVLTGYVLISLIHPAKRMGVVPLAGLAAAVGAGTVGSLLFWASLMGFVPSRRLLAVLCCLAAVGWLLLKRKNRLIQVQFLASDHDKPNGWLVALLLVMGAGLALMVTGALATPLTEWDSLAIWGLKAKVLAHEALRPVPDYFHDLTLSYSHLDYPLMVPFLTAGAYAAMGTVDDQTGKLVSLFLDLLMVPLLYTGLRWKLPRLPAVCLCAILTLLPVMFRYAGVGCADLPLAMFYTGGIFYAAKWIEEQQRHDLILAILFSAFAAFTKNEGLVLALTIGLVILGFGLGRGQRRAWAGGMGFFAGLLAINAAWLIWRGDLPRTHEDYGSKLSPAIVIANLPKLKQILPVMAVQTVEFPCWGMLWILLGMMTLLGWRAFARRHVLAVWMLLAQHLMIYALVYSVTPWEFSALVSVTMDRLLLHAVPAVILLIGWHWASLAEAVNPSPLHGEARR